MKKLITITMILLFSTFLNAQSNYESQWEKVKAFENKGLPKSALAEVETIYQFAKNTKNSAQIIKAILYKSKYTLTLEEDAQLTIINHIKEEIANASSPEKNMLESILANLYWQYFQNNRYQFYNRTHTTEKVDKTDFRTWDLHTIFKEIDIHFQNALANGLILKNTSLAQFDDILNTQKNSKLYRPTVYDFIAHKALEFYQTGESNLAQPEYKFEIENPDFLANNNTFIKADFSSKDVNSQKLKALLLYKDLTEFHLKDEKIPALGYLTLERLNFVRQNARFSDKETVYFNTLKSLQKTYRKDPFSTEIDYRIAQIYRKNAGKYNEQTGKKYQFENEKALAICNEANALFPKSNGAKKCINLKSEITQPSVQINVEKYIEVAKESRLLIRYKNATKMYFKVFKSNRKFQEGLHRIYKKSQILNKIKSLDEVTHFSNTLKNIKDYQLHATEVILPQLAQGEYLILASSNADFNDDNNFSYGFTQATDFVLIENHFKANYQYQVVQRETGKPVANAKVHIKNYNISRYNKKIDKTFTTDAKGFISFSPSNHHNQVEITVSKAGTKGVFRYYNLYENRNSRNSHDFVTNQVFLFTDRSIYRPSQTVYFKGIAVEQQENKSAIIANSKVQVTLKDANYQDVKTLDFVTNEFGSFAGEFILPNNGLTGRFEIVVNGTTPMKRVISMRGKNNESRSMRGQVSFSVEEYKRPKFSAKFNKITQTFKLNDEIKIKGTAIAYAGANITDAKVVYRVKRKVQYPRWWYWYRPYGYRSEAQEITHGETKTNEKGEFEIPFIAKPDVSVDKKDLPVFNYEITADITDINGETRSTSTIVRVGYHSQTIAINIDTRIDKSVKENSISIETKNLNGEFVPTKGTLKIYKVKAPKNVYRNRPWQIPDFQEIPEDTFEKLFPHDSYKQEKEILGDLVFTTSFDTSKDKKISLKKIKKWQSGAYIAVAEAKDNFQQKVTDKAQFSLFSTHDKTVADKQFFDISLDKDTYKVGENVKVILGTASKDMTVVIYVEKHEKIVDTKIIHLNNEIKSLTIPVNKNDVGGFGISYHLVNYNSFLGSNLIVSVPFEKMDLEIETVTFRDKLQPASEETWSFKIKGNKKDKVLAEVLTSMYDASLDQFKTHQWQFQPIYNVFYYPQIRVNSGKSFGVNQFRNYNPSLHHVSITHQSYDDLNWFGFYFGSSNYGMPVPVVAYEMMEDKAPRMVESAPRKKMKKELRGRVAGMNVSQEADEDGAINVLNFSEEVGIIENDFENTTPNTSQKQEDFGAVKVRTNFNETAFFFPQLKTDKDGNISFSFTTPESLTKWKLQLVAHTKELQSATKSLETVTQKDLMVLPNPPRFLREGDEIVISSKIANLTDKQLSGQAQLELFDAITNKNITKELLVGMKTEDGRPKTEDRRPKTEDERRKTEDGRPKTEDGRVNFSVTSKGNTNVSWTLHIPENIQAVQYKIVAKAGDFSDGEQNVLPVLSNRMLVTETLPMWIRSNQTKTFTLDKLKNTVSSSRKNHKLTLEVTSNPAWYAVQALPYLMEYPYECAEQTFSRYYANTLASHIANSNPKIQQVFNQWKNSDALLSNLEKNQELKSLIIQETPWLRDAQSETEQKKRIALLFDLNKMKNEQKNAIHKLKQLQMSSGGFPWFKGSRYENRYITQHIVAGFGHLDKLGVFDKNDGKQKTNDMTKRAISYLDKQLLKDYNDLLRIANKMFANEMNKEQKIKEYLEKNHTSHFQVHYLYTRSFFKDLKVPNRVKVAFDYYTKQSYKYWLDYNLYSKGLIALISHRNDNNAKAEEILRSLKETSISNEELGMYWKENTSSYYWYQAPIETQALMVEVFAEIIPQNIEDIDNLKIWLLKNKQTNRWKTTKATTEAVYALLLQGTDWISTTDFVEIKIANKTIKPLELDDVKVEAGTGYYKTSWNGNEITPEMAKVTIKKEGEGIAWGALYWQYFEDLDKITMAETPLKLKKKLFLKTNEDRGEQLTEITDKTKLKLGDLVRVRIELRVDRAMEFIHMKDMRAAGFEPVNVISQYKWQDGLGYYESTKDASTNFFIDYLPKGVFVFEYDLRVNNKGDFSNGITTIQSMYAPEFSSHSEGIRVKIE